MKIIYSLDDIIQYGIAGIVLLIWLIWFCINWLPIIIKQWWNNRKKGKKE